MLARKSSAHVAGVSLAAAAPGWPGAMGDEWRIRPSKVRKQTSEQAGQPVSSNFKNKEASN